MNLDMTDNKPKSTSRNAKRGPQSPELAGGAGFTFEDAVAASYLTALLDEGYAPGITNRTVSRVALQQRNFGEPLDDVIIDFTDPAGQRARLSLQVKRALTISAVKSNTDFRDIIRDSWATYQKPDFLASLDRYGAAVGQIAAEKARALQSLCDLARESDTADHFEARFAKDGHASAELKSIKKSVAVLLAEAKGSPASRAELHGFLAHFVLVQFDFLHAGANDPPQLVNRLRECLSPDQAAQAPLVWSTLRQLARDSDGKAGVFDRSRLVGELAAVVRLKAAGSLRGDLEKLAALATDWLADIQNDVGGSHLNRNALFAELESAVAQSRFVQIRGLPGSGKSVLLRQAAERALQRGPALFLKSDRLEGKSWTSFATAIGISNVPLPSLLAEIAATGSDTFYIDGIDRIEKEHQPIILDVLRSIFRAPFLKNWKVVVSLRDTGIEPVRNWLGEFLNVTGVATVEVKALDENEAEELARAKPQLRRLLFGPARVSAIVRRPFFAKILSQNFTSDPAEAPFEPHSEVDLIERWWKRGGYNAAGQDAIDRQRAVIEFGAFRARNLGDPIALSNLTERTTRLVEQMVADGILQHVRHGHSVRFSHDIFFEWSFLHVLVTAMRHGSMKSRHAESRPALPASSNSCPSPPIAKPMCGLIFLR
jgi:hypothetical protein